MTTHAETYTSNQVAAMTGKTRRAILQAAERHSDIGRKHGRDWLFTAADVDRLKTMRPGRRWPAKPSPEAADA